MSKGLHNSIGLIGTGNFAWHLSHLLKEAGLTPDVHYGRRESGFEGFEHIAETQRTKEISSLKNLNAVFIAVSDKSISSLSSELADSNSLLIHVSGGKSIEALKGDRRGVFYIPQTLTKGRRIDLSDCRLCIEADQEDDLKWMESLGEKMALKSIRLNSEKRKHLHLAAVFANNFTNHMYTLAEEYLEKNEIPRELIHPLIDETARKALDIGPLKSQTGPAKRGDLPTIKKHLKLLKNIELKRLYRQISNHIFDRRGKDI